MIIRFKGALTETDGTLLRVANNVAGTHPPARWKNGARCLWAKIIGPQGTYPHFLSTAARIPARSFPSRIHPERASACSWQPQHPVGCLDSKQARSER